MRLRTEQKHLFLGNWGETHIEAPSPYLAYLARTPLPNQSFPLCKQFKKQNKSLLTFSKITEFSPALPKGSWGGEGGGRLRGFTLRMRYSRDLPAQAKNPSVQAEDLVSCKTQSPTGRLEQVATTSSVCSLTRPLWLLLLKWVNKNKSACLFKTHTHTPTHTYPKPYSSNY